MNKTSEYKKKRRGGAATRKKKNYVNLNFILHVYETFGKSEKWGFKEAEGRVWVGEWMRDTGGRGGREVGTRRRVQGIYGASGVFWGCPRLPLWQAVLGRAILPVG